ncbi:coproporphyrinogen III oxidase [Superficieibacter electus]|uniref:Coproporphyrinogen III oxidase n=1 Tax=Superficieibacter electus TaxID=2022662 RepID=A0A2P5GLQ0_9ENTR|nr:STM4012 family radical SAM protein [Superficieibacter electus]POP43887.1 coproporphyrinogen III oxidase [Superficieibacter electus]POP46193.1 coproporphyrinogen III oxidase [Superficieibacter electus]
MNNNDIYRQYMYSYPHKKAYRALTGINFHEVKSRLYEQETHLYVHMPFCQSRCGFCNLFTCTGAESGFIDRYIAAIVTQCQQMDLAPVDWASFTVGGGTPLLLNVGQLHTLFTSVFATLNIDRDIYKTIETSPSDTTPEKIALLNDFAVNRVSIGVQSFNDDELKTLHRRHSAASARQALEWLKDGDFPSLNIDIIYGIPGQTHESLTASLNQALCYQPEEIFLYPLYNMPRQQNMHSSYVVARDRLRNAGYTQTSMRRFVLAPAPSAAAKSCGFENSLALGAGGRSYLSNLHYCTPWSANQQASQKIIQDFIDCEDKTTIKHGYVLSDDEMKRRFIIKNLFFWQGLSLTDYRQHFGSEALKDFPDLQTFIQQQCCYQYHDRLRLTESGMALSDRLGPMFISSEVMLRENRKR